MRDPSSLSDLEAFAKDQIDAHRYPDDVHIFKPFQCDACGIVPLEMIIEHHTGSQEGDFKGEIHGTCTECGSEKLHFRFTGENRKRLRREKPDCECGNGSFLVGECERIEGEGGLKGFFDEGVVVAKCSRCGRNRVLIHTE